MQHCGWPPSHLCRATPRFRAIASSRAGRRGAPPAERPSGGLRTPHTGAARTTTHVRCEHTCSCGHGAICGFFAHRCFAVSTPVPATPTHQAQTRRHEAWRSQPVFRRAREAQPPSSTKRASRASRCQRSGEPSSDRAVTGGVGPLHLPCPRTGSQVSPCLRHQISFRHDNRIGLARAAA